jgi:GH15 family glucan-1,4-alpha-glucosidase
MWSTVVVGTHPIQAGQIVLLELTVDDQVLGSLPGFWLENRGVNSLWHVALPPQAVGSRIRYRVIAESAGEEPKITSYQEVVVRPNLPMKTEHSGSHNGSPEGLVGNRRMTVKVDRRGTTYDIFFPSVGLHSDVRPLEGELAQSRLHFQAIQGGLAAGRRLDWFDERLAWDATQAYRGATNVLVTDLQWRQGPIRVVATDFAVMGPSLPRTAGGNIAPGQYLKRYQIINETSQRKRLIFGLFVHTEVNGGMGETGLAWRDDERVLVAFNRGHFHVNRKLCRDSTIEFAIALDDRGETHCEAAGANEVILLRPLEIEPGETAALDVLVSGAFTGWSGDQGTFEHWTRPALAWFRSADLDAVERETAEAWSWYIDPLPTLFFPRPQYANTLQRSTLAALLHCDEEFGSSAGGYDRGLSAYSWPRDTMSVCGVLDRCGHPQIGCKAFQWLQNVRNLTLNSPHAYWFQKYTIDGWAEWETPSLDQSATIPWALERHYRRTGDLEFVARHWRAVEIAARVCGGNSGHPGMCMLEDRALIRSAGAWDNRFGAFLYSNATAVAGLRSACRLAAKLGISEPIAAWQALADRMWERGILAETRIGEPTPGLYDAERGRFLEARCLCRQRGLWSTDSAMIIEHSPGIDVTALGLATPLALLPAADERVRRTATAFRELCAVTGDRHALTLWAADPAHPELCLAPGETHQQYASSLAALWVARYLIQLGKETGDPQHWDEAIALIDNVLDRLGPLGLAFNPSPDPHYGSDSALLIPKVVQLHVPLLEALLDLAGLDWDAAARTLILEPALPPAWPEIGVEQDFNCGRVAYRLHAFAPRRPSYRLSLSANLRESATLQIQVASPGSTDLGTWRANPPMDKPKLDRKRKILSWSVDLAAGEHQCDWSWG